MRKSFWNRKIPTIIGIVFITAGIIITTLLVKRGTIFQINAGPGQDPIRVEITNISNGSFTVSYTTSDKVIGTLIYGSDRNTLDNVALDDRDQISQSVSKYTAHSITVKNLSPDTNYFFSISSGDKKYINGSSPYEVKTGSSAEEPTSQVPLSGKTVLPDGTSPSDGLVYVSISGAQKISTFIKSDGTYTIPLNNLKNTDLDDNFPISKSTIIPIEIISGNLTSSASVSPEEISPVPLITLSNNYDFSDTKSPMNTELPQDKTAFPTFGPPQGSTGNNSLSPTTTISPSPSPTPINLAAASISPSPTIFNSPTPSDTPEISVTAEISPAPTLPPTGNSSVIIASIALVAALAAGLLLFLLTRGQKSI